MIRRFNTVIVRCIGTLALSVLSGCAAPDSTSPDNSEDVAETSEALSGSVSHDIGAFTCDFRIPSSFPAGSLGPVIERDRMYMAARKGFITKRIPVAIDQNGDFLSGGRYLFKTPKRAKEYKEWVEEEFALDGTLFFDRDYFFDIDCHAWTALAVYESGDPDEDHIVVRTERFAVPAGTPDCDVEKVWQGTLNEAKSRGYTSTWLLYNKAEGLASVVYTTPHSSPPPGAGVLDEAAVGQLATAAPLGHRLVTKGWPRVFDRTQFVLTVWHPFKLGDHGEPASWPNSPPLPAPYCGDGVCEVSRGESSASCAQDCVPTCGNMICNASENTNNCPGDCRL